MKRCPNCGSTAQYQNGQCGCGYTDPPAGYDSWEDYEQDQAAAAETIQSGDY